MTVPDVGLSVVASEQDGVPVLVATGELESVGAPVLRSAVIDALAAGADGLVIDLTDVTFVDSAGLGVLAGALKRCRERGGELALVATRPVFLRTLRVTGLARVLPVFPALSAAVAHVTDVTARATAPAGAESASPGGGRPGATTLPRPRWASRRPVLRRRPSRVGQSEMARAS
ncbi:STAS domain-containing protein [Motilibacter deserti]|uniref:Anti-sigma factor antagonist n=1 Tax=Motilibacter deserti TaxID=2714956 RepID=A0ABX0GYB0_9ACTN|nr:STAS domain-containing protein [Motilibacter deserti]NHC15096.1 STAS domain-containing protein [Motilibacter deserti]